MSEKRFQMGRRIDVVSDIYDSQNDKLLILSDVVDLLNEQQATINELKEENKKLIEEWEFSFRTEMAHHRFAEKELQEKIREKQATISQLEEENEQLKKARDESDKFIVKKGLEIEFLEWCIK